MEPDGLRPGGILEVATHPVAPRIAELIEVVRFGEDRRADAACDVSRLGGFLDDTCVNRPAAGS